MGRKFFSHAWIRNEEYYPGIADTKEGLAYDLILMGDIKVSAENKKEALSNPATYLEKRGWKWEELPPSKQSFS